MTPDPKPPDPLNAPNEPTVVFYPLAIMDYDDNFLDYPGDFDDDDGWNEPSREDFSPPRKRPFHGNMRENRYGNAYGNYQGGYGPGGGFGPPVFFGNRGRSRLFSGPPGPGPFPMGRGFGPGGPKKRAIQHRSIKYLQRCGVEWDHLRNLPNDLLDMITPEFCGLCSTDFESFTLSRIHYSSKNHLKNQKKWITKSNELSGGTTGKEIPLKSRDLYCELCDVHITSKPHAESHYAGKAHRSIVEGRKNPKNPFLLQNGMQPRVDQLIRREKRHMKTVLESELVAEEPKEQQLPKLVQPELYCDICKTSVTCSEQMTSHLNGKRHLSKEKQHILNVMKGEAAADEEENDEKEKGEDDDAEAEGEEGPETAEEAETVNQEDWENGDGNWDDPANKDTNEIQ